MKYDKYFRVLRKYLWSGNNDVLEVEALLLGQKEQKPNDVPEYVFSEGCTKYVTIPLPKITLSRETSKDASLPYAFTLSVPDNKITGGTFRGWGAVDLQTLRGDPSQVAQGDFSFVVGYNNSAKGRGSITMGYQNITNKPSSIAIGSLNTLYKENSVAIGSSNNLYESSGVAFGHNNYMYKSLSTCIGYLNSSKYCGLAVGEQNTAEFAKCISFGVFNKGLGSNAILVGEENHAKKVADTPLFTTFFGSKNYNLTGITNNTLIGFNNYSTTAKATVIGNNFFLHGSTNKPSGANSIKVGRGFNNIQHGSVMSMLGFGSDVYLAPSNQVYTIGYSYDTYYLHKKTDGNIPSLLASTDEGSNYTNINNIQIGDGGCSFISFSIRGDSLLGGCLYIGKGLIASTTAGVVSIIGLPTIMLETKSSNFPTTAVRVFVEPTSPTVLLFEVTGASGLSIYWECVANLTHLQYS